MQRIIYLHTRDWQEIGDWPTRVLFLKMHCFQSTTRMHRFGVSIVFSKRIEAATLSQLHSRACYVFTVPTLSATRKTGYRNTP